ncbi:protein unc-93 homolog A-like [Mizuhopecten yessoensis]|uniref:Protein unc-93-like A n=1 Tax=Mizuhopecten yessoensis TaxID=6573 RepID=A0A210PE11_MIZYE|nr:protein unc-93 homolog A-like [Mizuhopecten yessoensis]XP_021343837.1 protein unc-93 homolog A-like [Mizuhopecten yessoensis]OWF34739.1 Protein unc-93-like A [Mizuhopecten yessoensis]
MAQYTTEMVDFGKGYQNAAGPSPSTQTVDHRMSKKTILKNVVVVSFGFLFLFTSFQSLSNLQSSLNKDDGLGTGGLAIVYGALVVSCMFFPAFIVGQLGCKWTVALSMICYIVYMAANFYAVWGTMAVASVIVGLGAAPLWSAKCTYLTQTAVWYAKHTGATEDDVINRFFGFFFMVFQTSQVWGNLISSTVFSQRPENETIPTTEELARCGAAFDPTAPSNNNTNLARPPIEKVYIVCGIYIACSCVAFFIIAGLLDQIKLDKDKDIAKEDRKLSVNLLVATFRHWWNSPYQKLLMPLTIYSGIEQAFITGDYTKSFISCTLGIWNVGYVMICYGVVDAICSFTFGRLVQYVGHIPFFILAFLVHGGTLITLLLWQPDPDRVYLFYIFAALWGMGDAVIQTQINALYGYLFTKNTEAAFANYRLWESVGFILAFGYSAYLETRIKMYMAIGWLVLGMMMYCLVEIGDRMSKKSSHDIIKTKL